MKYFLFAMMAASALAFGSEGEGGGGGGAGGYLKMEPMVVNLSPGHYIQFIAQIKPAKSKDGKSEGAEKIPLFMPIIRHEMLKSLIGQDAQKVSTPQFMDKFANDTAELINRVLDEKVVEGVFFENWIIQ